MRISDWSSDVCSSDLRGENLRHFRLDRIHSAECLDESFPIQSGFPLNDHAAQAFGAYQDPTQYGEIVWRFLPEAASRAAEFQFHPNQRSEEHTPELQSLMRISYAVFCLNNKIYSFSITYI